MHIRHEGREGGIRGNRELATPRSEKPTFRLHPNKVKFRIAASRLGAQIYGVRAGRFVPLQLE